MSSNKKVIINNHPDPITFYCKIGAASSTAVKRAVIQSSPCLESKSSAPSINADSVKLEDCEEEFDREPREAKFAFRSTDLGSWGESARSASAASSSATGTNTDSDPKTIQHWALVVHFPRGKKTYLFEAWRNEQNGHLQAGRAEILFKDFQVFEKATYFGTVETSPCQLLTKANQVLSRRGGLFQKYNVFDNNCQTWLTEFVHLISPELLLALYKKIPATETYLSYLSRMFSS